MTTSADALRQLTEQQRRLEEQATALEHDLAAVVAASEGSNADDEHDPEGATIAFERQQLVALLTATREHLAEVERAVAGLAAGDYGRCERCGADIGAARLTARPSARTCISCARR